MRILLGAALLAAFSTAYGAPADELKRKAPPEIDDALQSRVHTFYELFQRGDFRGAEAFVAPESRDHYYNARKNRIVGFDVESINYSDDFRTARVLVRCMTLAPMLGSQPVGVPVQGEWRFLDDDWYLHLGIRAIQEDGTWRSPAGIMTFQPESSSAASAAPQQPMTVDALRNLYSVSSNELAFPAGVEEPVSRAVTVQNRAQGGLTVAPLRELPEGVEVSIDAPKMEAGGQAVITITCQPAVLAAAEPTALEFAVEPIGQTFEVKLLFEEQALPAAQP